MTDKDQVKQRPTVLCHTYVGHQRIIAPGVGVAIQLEVDANERTGQAGRLYFNVLIRSEDARILAESLLDGIEQANLPPKSEQH